MPTQLAPSATRAADAAEPRTTPRISPRRSVIALTAVTALATAMAALAATPFGGLVIKPAVHLVSSTSATKAHERTATSGDSLKAATSKSSTTSSASSSQSGSTKASSAPPPSGNAWATRDSDILSGSTAPYFIAGTIYGDPPGNHFGVTTMSSSDEVRVRRGGKSAGSLTQMVQSVTAVNGTIKELDRNKRTGGGKIGFELSSGQTIVIDTYGWVKINGQDAFNLSQNSAGTWTSSASGPQIRAFLAGFMEGEGSVKGLVGDDPSSSHLQLVAHLMATSQAYSVPTTLTGKRYFRLYVASAYFPRVQAYPFMTYVRCPGGNPN